ncbi:MAG: DUF4258 domain-containing protein [Rhodocyclaceae bacterium]|nr:DUF4258 domain-containing protein [Rhodocyclaceae bacterium]
MPEKSPPRAGLSVAVRPDQLIARIRQIATDTRNVKWSDHARDRMRQRGISIRVALNIIQEGYPSGEIEPGQNPGEWKVKIVRNVKGNRDVGVVVLILRYAQLLVKTVEWEDLK